MKKKKVWIILGIVSIFAILVGVSFALWTATYYQNGENIVKTDCFNIEFTEGEGITLNNAYPIPDSLGKNGTPYIFTITNMCESQASFQINLETMSQSGVKVLPDKYVKANLQEGETNRITTVLDKTTNTSLDTTTTIEGASEAYKLYTGTLKEKESKTFHLRVWMDEKVGAVEDAMNASYLGKVSITTSYKVDPFKDSGTLAARTSEVSTENYYAYSDKITRVVFEPILAPKENASFTYDVSAEGTEAGSVMAYLALNEKTSEEETDSYTLYIQGKGGVRAPSNCDFLFYNFTKLESIEGLEYFDTSNVTEMDVMFANCSSLTTLDLSSFNTSNVTHMDVMFTGCSSLTTLDLSSFNTSNVTDMLEMFAGCSSLTTLDLSNFNTSSVTVMNNMFADCNSLTTLDLSSFNTSNVTEMADMFANCNSLTTLDLSNFNTSSVTGMNNMFTGCSSLTTLDLSNFDTSSVTNMGNMFTSCSSLTELNVSSFNTSNVTDMYEMFADCTNLNNITYGENFVYVDGNTYLMFDNCPANKPTHASWNDVTF